jgi:type II secretory pathway pseudopilin PulG
MYTLPLQLRSHCRTCAGPAGVAGRARGARGFSLVEAMVSAGIVGVMLVASVNLLSSAARTRVADSNRRTALLLAQQLMSEVIAQPYKDESLLALLFGPELGENTRADYDDVDDYSNYQEKPLKDRSGVAIAGFNDWKRKVMVNWVSADTLNPSLLDSGIVLVQVTVTDPRGVETSVYALRAERAVPADALAAGSTWAQWTDIDLEVGGATPRHVVTGVNNVTRPPAK